MNFIKYIFIAGILTMVSQDAFAQSKNDFIPNPETIGKQKKLLLPFSDTVKNKIGLRDFDNGIGKRNISHDIVINVPKPVYQFNNRQGFDVYKSPFDGMSILMPDKSFSSNMPVTGKSNNSKTKEENKEK
ncbi:MAG: hypothetical protein LBE82_11295 [Chitinophagaceae bacterium]|jgi:hypothetical protein|nr:hypothetical protein [Chitinophagaceae bacterium]